MQDSKTHYKTSELIKKSEKYVRKYLSEMQNHLELSDQQLIKIVKGVLYQLKKETTTKKWWHFFKK